MWWCCAPRVRAARSQCTSLFYADGGRREHDHCKAQGRLCDTSLLLMRTTSPGRSVGVDGGLTREARGYVYI